jgi:predicted sulfurtransferase
MSVINISGYKFIPLEKIATLRVDLRKYCKSLDLVGTILLSVEGININLSGVEKAIAEFKLFIKSDHRFHDIVFKESISTGKPFSKMLVKLKNEIVTMGIADVHSPSQPNNIIDAKQLKQWLDEDKDFLLLDTRNDYETKIGTFRNAEIPKIKNFREFPQYVSKLEPEKINKPIVVFCTGGVRCEKAMPWLEQQGLTNVYQLHGGILKYFEECGGAHWQGECFVFDDRIAVTPDLNETGTKLCTQCQFPVTQNEQVQSHYTKHQCCLSCAK